MIDQGNLIISTLKKWQILKISSWEDDTTELELSVESRSFVNQVNDQVRKRQKRISNVAGEGEEHSIIWGMFMAVTMNSATFMGKEFPRQSEFHCEYTRSHTEENVRHLCKISGRTR